MRIVFPVSAENGHVVFSPKEQAQLSAIDHELNQLIENRRGLIMQFAKESGVVKKSLTELKSSKGEAFTNTEEEPDFAQSPDGERAYLCAGFHNNDPGRGCGWVKGSPIKQPYASLSPLHRSTGHKQLCYLCGTEIHE